MAHRVHVHVSVGGYVATWIALLALTTLTLLLSFVHLGPFSTPIALVIAAGKALLVALFFMHLVEQRAANWLALLAGVLLLGVFVALAAADPATRPTTDEPIRPPAAGSARPLS
ncbi:MAG TPA: cytochrome C oxidase subunit IV family protein, partial [Thermodesulfobacteriota bacterium]